uniref:U3 small nucleolar RNA-associated protein 11 n=1 Tax=Panagrolaimus sp. JU765 TaxID=591449 RepID=A0AC34QLF6_9BILA
MSLRKFTKINQRIHHERPQPLSRKKAGYLEHKKDWIQRARDHQEKVKKLKELRRKALERNPDEYHHHMTRSGVGFDGVHRELAPDSDDETVTQKMFEGVRDLHYVQQKLSMERKKIEKLKSVLHLVDSETSSSNSHIIFVDDEDEAKNFDPAEFFQTTPGLLGRKYNRLPKTVLEKKVVLGADDKESIAAAEELKRAQYKELKMRLQREKELNVVVQKLQLKKDLADSTGLKPTLEKKGSATTPAVYKWIYDRKK